MSKFQGFAQFYPFYLAEHQHRLCRRLHFIGSSLALALLSAAAWRAEPTLIFLALVSGYGCAWAGHYFYEHNRPATLKHPFYSFIGDWVMFKDMMIGKLTF